MDHRQPCYNVWYLIALLMCINSCVGEDPFFEYVDSINKANPVLEAKKRIGSMPNSIQPYYICDNPEAGTSISPSAWHFSCKQSCTLDQAKHHINISRMAWHFIGDDIPVYKITTSLVCYTSHENLWGSCSQSQTITPDKTTVDDIHAIPRSAISREKGVKGVQSIVNSKTAPCDYFSDNTVCGRDYIITHTTGKLSRKSDDEPIIMNIYSDGLRVDPAKGQLSLGDAMWVWDYDKKEESKECGWRYAGDTTCKYTSSSDILYCPDIGYQYVVRNLSVSRVCNQGNIYDKDGPAPFQFKSKEKLKNQTEVAAAAMKGKPDPDISLIQGINSALSSIEEAYCSSSCDLFSRGGQGALDVILDTPIGNWRVGRSLKNETVMTPCSPTSTWRIKSPTTMCHGKNHILVEDSETRHSCSWDTTKEYIMVDDLCSGTDKENTDSMGDIRKDMSSNIPIVIKFWTGDSMRMDPPYERIEWEHDNMTYSPNPGWFSKVTLTKDMLHNRDDISGLLTTMATDMKTEIYYNKTNRRTMKRLLLDEITDGAGSAFTTATGLISSLLFNLPKALILITVVIGTFWIAKISLYLYIKRRAESRYKTVLFSEPLNNSNEGPHPPVRSSRIRSRTRMLANDLQGLNL